MITPYDYYRTSEWVAEKMSDLKQTFADVEAFATARNAAVFWRGQVDHTWSLTSSLVRLLSESGDFNESMLNAVEDKLLKEASDWVLELADAKFSTPLAKLAYLQHHKVPTRLLDFSSNPWTATFFAAERLDQVDGRLFALIVSKDAVIDPSPGTPWRSYKQSEIKVFNPSAHNINFTRLNAQHGVLTVGRLPSTTPHRKALDPVLNSERALLAEEIRRVLSLPFSLKPLKDLTNPARVSANAVLPIGLTIRLHVDKASVRSELAGRRGNRSARGTTTHKTVYPDVLGMVDNSLVLRALKNGALVL